MDKSILQKEITWADIKKCITRLKNNILDNITETAIIILLPIIMFLLLGPVETYYGNVADFDFVLKDFIGIFIVLSVVSFLLIVTVISLLPRKWAFVVNRVICVINILFYVQGMFLNTKLAESDGTLINWDDMKSVMVYNLIVWVVLFLALLFIVFKYKKIAIYFSTFLSLIQLIAFISVLISILKMGSITNFFQLTTEDQLVLGKENVIIIVLDSVGANYFLEALQSSEQYEDTFKDFTFYDNYDSLYAPTFPSMSHLLTGIEPDVNLTHLEWLESAWNSDSCGVFYDKLHAEGYVCNLYACYERSLYGQGENLLNKFDNLDESEYLINKRKLTEMMLKYSLFRYTPYIVKPHYEVDISNYSNVVFCVARSRFKEDIADYLNCLEETGLSVGPNEKLFVLTHLRGIHKPLDINEYGRHCENSTYQQVLLGNMYLLNEYFEQLKSLGIYDSSTIIVMADHPVMELDDEIGFRVTRLEESLFMIKRQGENSSSMRICHAPICSDDFRATILDLIGLDYSEEGTSIYDWQEGQIRERTSYITEGGLWGYTYYTDGEELSGKLDSGFDVEMPASNW